MEGSALLQLFQLFQLFFAHLDFPVPQHLYLGDFKHLGGAVGVLVQADGELAG